MMTEFPFIDYLQISFKSNWKGLTYDIDNSLKLCVLLQDCKQDLFNEKSNLLFMKILKQGWMECS